MNIDIVTKQVSKKLNYPEKKVALLNRFYWRNVYDHFYSYNEQPLNIEYICVFFNDKWLVKKYIKYYIAKIRRTRTSKKFKPDSPMRISYIENYKRILRDVWRLRKVHKYTN